MVNAGGEGRCEEVDELVTGVAISCQYDVGSNGVPPGKRARATPEARVGLTSDVIWPDECRSPLAPFGHHPLTPIVSRYIACFVTNLTKRSSLASRIFKKSFDNNHS